MPGIFISYRRSDSSGYTGRLSEHLSKVFSPKQLFRDIDDIPPGVDFVQEIDKAIGRSSVLLVVIGPQWVSATDAQGQRRLDDAHDFVRLEIAAALQRDMPIIPLLVNGATPPSPDDLPPELEALSRRNAMELSDTRWQFDVDRLVNVLASEFRIPRQAGGGRSKPPRSGGLLAFIRNGVLFAGLLALLYVLAIVFVFPDPDEAEDEPITNGVPVAPPLPAPIDKGPLPGQAANTGQVPINPAQQVPQPPATTAIPGSPPALPNILEAKDLSGRWQSSEGILTINGSNYSVTDPLGQRIETGFLVYEGNKVSGHGTTATGRQTKGSYELSANGNTLSGSFSFLDTGETHAARLQRMP